MVPPSPSPSPPLVRCGVGIDTSRYGHYVCFLRDDFQPAAPELSFPESAAGYGLFRHQLERIVQRHGPVHFLVRLDAAGQYADNLLHYLHGLGSADPGAPGTAPTLTLTLSCGDPQRNKNYRAALFGSKKSDAIEARAAARFALTERPAPSLPLSAAQRSLRQVVSRLQAVIRHRTRLVNQLHHLLALALPELALLTKDLAAGWVLELVHRYPTAPLLAAATPDDLAAIPYLPHKHIPPLLAHARASVASLQGSTIEELVRDQIRQVRDTSARQKRLEKLLVGAYRDLPQPNHLDTINGIGEVTAAVLTAFMVDCDRFAHPGKLVAYFGALPVEVASGVDRDGQPRGPKRYVMSRRGNDLVRRYLWMAALSAVRCNPAVRALYARVVGKHPQDKAIAIGHAMRKLLHLALAVWKTGKPFDPAHYHWDVPAHLQAALTDLPAPPEAEAEPAPAPAAANQAAGHKPVEPAQSVVTAARHNPFVDFGHLKKQLSLQRVLDHLGLSARLRGSGLQRRGPCPLHRGDARGRTFSVHLGEHVFQCFEPSCGRKGDVIDLWAGVHGMSLRDAALDLVQTFNLEPGP